MVLIFFNEFLLLPQKQNGSIQPQIFSFRFLKDFFTSMIDLPWSWTLLSFATSFLTSWSVFAVIWYLVVLTHGDLSEERGEEHIPCVDNINGFTSCFLFSLETQHTIG